MALEIKHLHEIVPAGGLPADRRLYETSQGLPCEDGDPRAAFLVVWGPGSVIPAATVKRLGLRLDEDGRITWGADQEPPKPGTAGSTHASDADNDIEELPDGYSLETLPGVGWYGLLDPQGMRISGEGGVELKVRGKMKAIEHFKALITERTKD